MKQLLLTLAAALCCSAALHAQISIDSTDMPVVNDTIRFSTSLDLTGLNLTDTGAGKTWVYANLTPVIQELDTYRTAGSVGYGGGTPPIPTSAYGYKVADSIPTGGLFPVTVKNIYTFFNKKSSPSRFVAEGFGAKLNGTIAIPAPYSDEDEVYFFPLTYGRRDSTTFKLTVTVPFLGSLKQQGYRITKADGYGTITTPYYTTPKAVIRVRSEVVEIDSVTYSGTSYGIPRHYVDYKWLAKGEHYPALYITTQIVGTTETPSNVRYRDSKRNLLGAGTVSAPVFETLTVYPNPAGSNDVTVKIPAAWSSYTLNVFDAAGRLVSTSANSPKVAAGALPAGHYTIIAESNGRYGATQFVK